MDEYSRPATLEDLKLLLRSLNEHAVDCLLIGGYALAAHGCQRATTDIDVLVRATAESGRRVKDALTILPDRAAKDIADRAILERAIDVARVRSADRTND